MLEKAFKNNTGAIMISVILGLGLAAMFRKSCTGNNCVVVKSPDMKDIENSVYRVNDNCFKYTPQIVACDKPAHKAIETQSG
jgi:hypothetical protein